MAEKPYPKIEYVVKRETTVLIPGCLQRGEATGKANPDDAYTILTAGRTTDGKVMAHVMESPNRRAQALAAGAGREIVSQRNFRQPHEPPLRDCV